jgi:hypothetical protein
MYWLAAPSTPWFNVGCATATVTEQWRFTRAAYLWLDLAVELCSPQQREN